MRVSLVLGSGGARGWAHVGAIEEIEARGHEIVAVSGASVGALVGGVYATGALPEFSTWIRSLTKLDVRRLYDFTFTRSGFIKGNRTMAEIARFTGEPNIEDLPIPFTAVASDLTTGREVWFQSGPLLLAMRASFAIPTVFTPILVGDHLLADGGMLNPVPIEPTLPVTADATIAVDLGGPRIHDRRETIRKHIEASNASLLARTRNSLHSGIQSMESGIQSVGDSLTSFTNSVRSSFGYDDAEANAPREQSTDAGERPGQNTDPDSEVPTPQQLVEHDTTEPRRHTGLGQASIESTKNPLYASKLPSSLGAMEVVDMSLSVMQQMIRRYREAANPVTARVTIPADAADTLEFYEASRLIDMGREATAKELDRAGL